MTLPGWGSWAGIGTSDKPKKRVIKKAGPTVPRKDEGLSHVIINTKKNRKIQPHLVGVYLLLRDHVFCFSSIPLIRSNSFPNAINIR